MALKNLKNVTFCLAAHRIVIQNKDGCVVVTQGSQARS